MKRPRAQKAPSSRLKVVDGALCAVVGIPVLGFQQFFRDVRKMCDVQANRADTQVNSGHLRALKAGKFVARP